MAHQTSNLHEKKQYLLGFLLSVNPEDSYRPKYTTSFYSVRETIHKLSKVSQLEENFFPEWMALEELNSINVFYSTWYLEDIAFNVTLKYFSIFMLLLSLKQAISLAISLRQDIFVVRLFLRFHGWDLKFMKLKCRQIYCFSSTAKLKCSKISFLN